MALKDIEVGDSLTGLKDGDQEYDIKGDTLTWYKVKVVPAPTRTKKELQDEVARLNADITYRQALVTEFNKQIAAINAAPAPLVATVATK